MCPPVLWKRSILYGDGQHQRCVSRRTFASRGDGVTTGFFEDDATHASGGSLSRRMRIVPRHRWLARRMRRAVSASSSCSRANVRLVRLRQPSASRTLTLSYAVRSTGRLDRSSVDLQHRT